MRVEVRPIERKQWHGKKGKDSFAQPKTVEVLYNAEKGIYDTGLNEQETEKYSKLMGVNLGNQFNFTEPHEFWSSKASWTNLPNQTLVLDTEKNAEFVKVANLKASKFVANSLKEHEDGLWPDATHVIYSEEEEMELKASKFQIQQKASVSLINMSSDGKADLVQILAEKTVKGRSQNFIDGMISELIETKPQEVIRFISMGKEEVTIRASVMELLSKGILNKQAGRVYYMGEQIALDYEDAVKYFKDPENSRMRVMLMENYRAND